MRKYAAALILFAASSFGQMMPQPPFAVFPPELRDYLGLTNDQVDRIARLNNEYNLKVIEKQQRLAQVQREIAEETQKTPLDPMGLGIRYAEMEAIRRDLVENRKRVQENARALLNDAQKAKLNVLNEAMKLAPMISAAQCEGLLETPQYLPIARVSPINADLSTLLPIGITGMPGIIACGGNIIPMF